MVGSDHGMDEEWVRQFAQRQLDFTYPNWRKDMEKERSRERWAREDRRLWKEVCIISGISAAILLFLTWATLAADLSVPDLTITPGAAACTSKEMVCNTKWGKDKRHVTAAMKREVFRLYGLSGNDDKSCRLDRHGRRFEIDHSTSRELCGADVVENLWPQCYSGRWNAVMKDRLENRLHRDVCSGVISLEHAQREIALDWRIPYRRYFGEPK